MMTELTLPVSTLACDQDDFAVVLKAELQSLPGGCLPLHRFTEQGGMVDDSNISVTVLNTRLTAHTITAKLGVFFTEVVGGCNCHDDPLQANVYAELRLEIDRQTAKASFS